MLSILNGLNGKNENKQKRKAHSRVPASVCIARGILLLVIWRYINNSIVRKLRVRQYSIVRLWGGWPRFAVERVVAYLSNKDRLKEQ